MPYRQNNLVFRYDNTPHYPDLTSFPHHKHLQNNVIVADEPFIINVIEEAELLASENTTRDANH